MMKKRLLIGVCALLLAGCTQESQNRLGRAIQNWTGTDGVLEVYSGGTLVRRIMRIDKVSTAIDSDGGGVPRPYRFGYGHMDLNLNFKIDDDEDRKIYFEISDYATNYVFFQNPNP